MVGCAYQCHVIVLVCAYSYCGLVHLSLTYAIAGILAMNDFHKVYKELFDAREKWKLIGLELGLQRSDLNNIEKEHTGNDRRLEEVLTMWPYRFSSKWYLFR